MLSEVPSELRLTFSGEVSDLGVQFMVTGPEGRDVVQGTPTVEGTLVTQALAEELANGDYEATWRVTSSDGHPISGTIPFTIEAEPSGDEQTGDEQTETTSEPDSTDEATTTAPPTEDSTEDSTTAPTAGPTEGSTDDAAQTTAEVAPGTEPTDPSPGMPFWAWLVAGLAAVGLVACGFLAFRRN